MRESFVIHAEYIEDLPKEHKSRFLNYCYLYGIHGIEPKVTSFELSVWRKIKRRIDADTLQYSESVLKNRVYVLTNKVKNNKATENEKELLKKYEAELSSVKLNKLNKNKQDLATYTPGVSDIEFDSDNDIDSVFDTDIDNDTDTDIESDNESESEYVYDAKKLSLKPTLDDVYNFIEEKQLNVNAEDFFNYYEAEDWKSVKNWKQKVQSWSRIEKKDNAKPVVVNDKWWEKK